MKEQVTIGHYQETRYWGVWLDGKLLAVTVYKKGAEAVRNALGEKQSWKGEDTARELTQNALPLVIPSEAEGSQSRIMRGSGPMLSEKISAREPHKLP